MKSFALSYLKVDSVVVSGVNSYIDSIYYPDEKKQKMKQCKSKFDYGKSLLGPQGLSAAVDFRLELGLQLQAELGLRVSAYSFFFLIV